MLPVEVQPHKAKSVDGRLSLVEAYRRDIDFWGNDERKIYHTLTKSLAQFLVKNVSEVRDNTFTFWCDIGCGPGFFLSGLIDNLDGPRIIPSGVDISPEALEYCRDKFGVGDLNQEFMELNLDDFSHTKGHSVAPWINAQVVSFIDTLYYLKNYRKTFNEIYYELQIGTVIVIADSLIRANMRDYPKSLDTIAVLGEWTDYTTPAVPRDGTSSARYLKYRVYRKMN